MKKDVIIIGTGSMSEMLLNRLDNIEERIEIITTDQAHERGITIESRSFPIVPSPAMDLPTAFNPPMTRKERRAQARKKAKKGKR